MTEYVFVLSTTSHDHERDSVSGVYKTPRRAAKEAEYLAPRLVEGERFELREYELGMDGSNPSMPYRLWVGDVDRKHYSILWHEEIRHGGPSAPDFKSELPPYGFEVR